MTETETRTHVLMQIAELIKALTLPVLFFVLLYLYHEPIEKMLTKSETVLIKVFGIELSATSPDEGTSRKIQQMKEQEDSLNVQIADLNRLSGKLTRERDKLAANNLDLTAQLKQALNALSRQKVNVSAQLEGLARQKQEAQLAVKAGQQLSRDAQERVADAQRTLSGSSKYDQARTAERAGFRQLLDDDYDAALASFEQATLVYPDFHNVSEIARLLGRRNADLTALDLKSRNAAKVRVYRQILEKLSWGMPDDVKWAMQEYLLLNQPQYVVEVMNGGSRKRVSDQLAGLTGEKRSQAVTSLIAALLPESDKKSYRVNLYIARTLAKMSPDWQPGDGDCKVLDGKARDSQNYADSTFKNWVDKALKPCPAT